MEANELLEKLKECVVKGKIDKKTAFPQAMKGQEGADELTLEALDSGIDPENILNESLIVAMNEVGKMFSKNQIFVPQMLISAKAMSASMNHLKPFFQSGNVKLKGTFIIGTVAGDLHDIGKNLVSMIVEGAGYKVIDLGVDVGPNKFIEQIKSNPDAVVGLSAMLTTTMTNMKKIIEDLKAKYPGNKVIIGGAPVNDNFSKEIGADAYAPGPQEAVEYLDSLVHVKSTS